MKKLLLALALLVPTEAAAATWRKAAESQDERTTGFQVPPSASRSAKSYALNSALTGKSFSHAVTSANRKTVARINDNDWYICFFT